MKWTVHGRRSIYASPWLELWLDDVEVPGGERFEHHVVRMRPTVTAVVFDDAAERVLLLWRHRFITGVWGWEVPGGWIDDDEAPAQAIQREVDIPRLIAGRQITDGDTLVALSLALAG